MSQSEFLNKKEGRPIDENEPTPVGYFVKYPDGYESWCPKFEFERVSREVSEEEALMINDSHSGCSDDCGKEE